MEGVRSRESLSNLPSSGLVNSEICQFLLGRTICDVNGLSEPLFVSNIGNSYIGQDVFQYDIDSYAYIGDSVPVKRNMGLIIRPSYQKSYRKNTGLTWSHETLTNNIGIGLHQIPNLQILSSTDISVSDVVNM